MTATEKQQVLFADDFSAGIAIGERWQYVGAGDFLADDGEVTELASGVSIAPAARNPDTGEPMITKQNFGPASHLKYLVNTSEIFPTEGRPLRVSFRASTQCFGTAQHPYGDEVIDPATDIRLGAGTFNVLDFVSGVVFDFWMTSTAIYPWYERLRLPGQPGEYATFGSVASPVPREPDQVHDLAIIIDPIAHTAQWEIDGTIVASIDRIGPPAPGWSLLLDHGGKPEDAQPESFAAGFGYMTLLDASLPPSQRGLVYVGTPLDSPTEFVAEGPDLFGQGVRVTLEQVSVERL